MKITHGKALPIIAVAGTLALGGVGLVSLTMRAISLLDMFASWYGRLPLNSS